MRHIRWACFLALLIGFLLPWPARAQQRAKEDVTLRGRILRPDGSPLANTPIYVDAVDSGFFGGTKRYSGATDGGGNYSFFFEDAKYQGEQTDTDYFLHVKMRSAVNGSQEVDGEYELELLEPVHNAPDMVLWDPAASVQTFERDLHLSYPPRQSSTSGADTYIGNTRIISSRTAHSSTAATSKMPQCCSYRAPQTTSARRAPSITSVSARPDWRRRARWFRSRATRPASPSSPTAGRRRVRS